MRADDDPVHDRLDGRAAPVGIPVFPRVPHHVRCGYVTEHGGRPGQLLVFSACFGDARFGALPDVQPVFFFDRVFCPVPPRLCPLVPGLADLLQQFRAARRTGVLAGLHRLLNAGGFQRVQDRAGHVLVQEFRVDRDPAASLAGRTGHAPARYRIANERDSALKPPDPPQRLPLQNRQPTGCEILLRWSPYVAGVHLPVDFLLPW